MVKAIFGFLGLGLQILLTLLIIFGFHYDEINEYNFIDFIYKFLGSLKQIIFSHLINSNYGKYIAEFILLLSLEAIGLHLKKQSDILKHIATSLKKDDVYYEDDIEDV